MPHAALCVVQLYHDIGKGVTPKFQCRTRLCGWCSSSGRSVGRTQCCFNATRGFVGGATVIHHCSRPSAETFQCRTRLCGWCNSKNEKSVTVEFTFQCRTRLCGWCNLYPSHDQYLRRCFNAARGFVGGATLSQLVKLRTMFVSMPHAALWVVQPH